MELNTIFRRIAEPGAEWVLLDTNASRKWVCRKYSERTSVLKVFEGRNYNVSGCQGMSRVCQLQLIVGKLSNITSGVESQRDKIS